MRSVTIGDGWLGRECGRVLGERISHTSLTQVPQESVLLDCVFGRENKMQKARISLAINSEALLELWLDRPIYIGADKLCDPKSLCALHG